jgi:aminoglycoside phosphotransferase family enzyme/predicted kinase
VHKVKKPVDFGFLDFTTLELRRQACEAEVALNRRLAPDVYLGVVPVTRTEHGPHTYGGQGEVVDYAVHMRRMPDAGRLDVLLAAGGLTDAHLEELATTLAAFHREARADDETARFGTPELVGVNVQENFAQTLDSRHAHLTDEEAYEIEQWQRGYLVSCADRFAARVASGHVRDGHGDLRLEQIYVAPDGALRILDCIEFNERFRFADVAADVAFFSMDLAFRGRVDLAERFLALYSREASDHDLYAVVDFYESYRAYVRAKIAAMLAGDESAPMPDRERAAAEARRYFMLALAAERRPLIPPSVIAVGGLIASGKSTTSDELSRTIGAPVVDSDRTRKHMVGARFTDKLYDGSWAGAYDPAFTEEVYDEVYRRAGVVLESGRPVVLDASFRSVSMRARAKALAEAHGVPFRFVECVAPAEVCKARLVERAKSASVSDGRLEIFDDFAKRWEPPAELGAEEHVRLVTSGDIEQTLRALTDRLPSWPDGLRS